MGGASIMLFILDYTGYIIRKYVFGKKIQKLKSELLAVYENKNIFIGLAFYGLLFFLAYIYWIMSKE
jgi:hypothetical protein